MQVSTERVESGTVRIRVGPHPTYLERLAVVFADPIRLKIVTELHRRETSPSGFFSAFGGGSLSRVDRHFKRLAEHGWLRQVRSESGGRRRGGTEHFYRAPKLAIFDNDTWAQLPSSIREEFSWRIFEQFAEQVRLAMEAGTFDARTDRHFTWTPLLLDEEGRSKMLAAVDGLFPVMFEEQDDAERRLARSRQQPIRVTLAMSAFDSPGKRRRSTGQLMPLPNLETGVETMPFTSRLARVFSSSLNLKIVGELNLREMSASQFEGEFGIPMARVYGRFQMLENNGWLEKVEERTGGRRRGATEHFFRAAGPAIYDTRSWSKAPEGIRRSNSWRIFEQLTERVRDSLESGTFDLRSDRHHTWTPLLLDERGWEQVVERLDGLFYYLLAEQKAARQRLRRSGINPLTATVYLAAFESPDIGAADPELRF